MASEIRCLLIVGALMGVGCHAEPEGRRADEEKRDEQGEGQPCDRVRACIRAALPASFDPARDQRAVELAGKCLESSVPPGCMPVEFGRHARDGRPLVAHQEHQGARLLPQVVIAYGDGSADESSCRCLGHPGYSDEGHVYLRCFVADQDAWREVRARAVRRGSWDETQWHPFIGGLVGRPSAASPIRVEVAAQTSPPKADSTTPLDLGVLRVKKPALPSTPSPVASSSRDVRAGSSGDATLDVVSIRYRVAAATVLRELLSPTERLHVEESIAACASPGSDLDTQGELDWDFGAGAGPHVLRAPAHCAPALALLNSLAVKLDHLPARHLCQAPIEVPFGGPACLAASQGAPYLGLRLGLREIRVLSPAQAAVLCSDAGTYLFQRKP